MKYKFTPQEILATAKKTPGTIVLVLATLAFGVYTQCLWRSAEHTGLINTYGYGLPSFAQGRWWTILAGTVISPEPWMFLIILSSIIVGCGYLEYRFGTLRMLAVVLISHIGSVLITAGLLDILRHYPIQWAIELARVKDVGMSNAGFGALGAATAGFSILWRQRVRFFIILYCITFILYSGYIWDITHFVAFLIGIVMGPWIVGKAYNRKEFPIFNMNPRMLIAGVASLSVYGVIVTRLYPGNGGIINFGRTVVYSASFLTTTLSVLLMVLFIYGLSKGKRFAWWAVLILTSITLVSSTIMHNSGNKAFNVIVGTLLIFLLLIYRKNFRVQSDALVRKKMILAVVLAFMLEYILHVSLVYAMRQSITPEPNLNQIAIESIYQAVGQSSLHFRTHDPYVNIIIEGIDTAWIITFLTILAIYIISTSRARNPKRNFAIFDRLMRQHGATSVTWMARWPKMNYWVNPSETAAFGFRLVNNVAIVLSDPVGSSQAIVPAIQPFHDFCEGKGWTVAYFSVSAKFTKLLAKHHFKAILIGEDTIIQLENLEFTGKNWQSVRSAFNKAEKANITMHSFKLKDAPLAILDQLNAIADSWVADKSLPEMGFTLGTLAEAQDPEVVMHVAVDPDGTVHGMTSWMPIFKDYHVEGWTIDIMQRRLSDQTMPGIIEFLIAKSAIEFKEEGAKYISLSAAPLANNSTNKTAIEKMLTMMADRMEPYYGFKSLYRYKQKFNPTHEPMYLCYDDEAKLPAIAAAIGKAYMNDVSYFKAALSIFKK